jgi:omega-amidase
VKVYCCQLDIAWENRAANFEKVERLLDESRPSPGALVALPEMAFTGFSMNVALTAREEPESTEGFLKRLSKRLGVYIVSGSVAPGAAGLGRNEAVITSPDGEVAARYQKMHLFSPADEQEHFEPGAEAITFTWAGGTAAPLICYDLRFPESFRAGVVKGAELFVVIANWPAAREGHWRTLLQARAIENQAYVAGVNRCGADPSHKYSGGSLIVAPDGAILADAGQAEGVISAELDWGAVRDWRRRFPALADMRMDLMTEHLKA